MSLLTSHRVAYIQQAVLGPTTPQYWAFNPAYAQVQNEHVWSTAWADIMTGGITPAGGGGQGVQVDRGDLRERPNRVGLTA